MATRRVILLPALLLLCGCAHIGVLYTDEVLPATLDFQRTPAGTANCVIKTYKVSEPVTGEGISVVWSRSDVKQAASNAGITNLYYADQRIRSFVFGIFSERTLIFYGE